MYMKVVIHDQHFHFSQTTCFSVLNYYKEGTLHHYSDNHSFSLHSTTKSTFTCHVKICAVATHFMFFVSVAICWIIFIVFPSLLV